MFKIKFLGGVGTVTGSRTLVEFHGKKFLVDCGLFQGPYEIRQQNWMPFPEAKDIAGIILTHAHIDHSGYLPKIVREGFRGPIYASEATADLCQIMLPDSAFLQEEDAKFANRTKHSRYDPALPLYTQKDAFQALELFQAKAMNDWYNLMPGLSFRFLRAGHILGSSLVEINFEFQNGSRQLTFSGDLGNGRSQIIEAPVSIQETDYLVLESTYGDRVHKTEDVQTELGNIVNRVIGRKGTLIIPAFAVGRTQEILYHLQRLESEKKIPSVPIYLDSPMAQDVTQIYLKHHSELKKEIVGDNTQDVLCPTCYREIHSTDESMLLCMSDEPKIVISAAGMLTGGRVLHHLKTKLPDEKSGVLFVGYQAQGTKGLLLKNGLKTIRLHHQEIPVEAEIFSLESLSAHADSNELIEWLKELSRPPEKVFLNHGESNALSSLKYRIEHELRFPVVIPTPGQEFEL